MDPPRVFCLPPRHRRGSSHGTYSLDSLRTCQPRLCYEPSHPSRMAPVDISSRRSPPSAKAPSRAPYPPPGSLPPHPNVPFSSPPLVSGPIARTFHSQLPKRFRLLLTGYPRAVPPSFPLPNGSPFKTSAPSLPPQSRYVRPAPTPSVIC